MGTSTSYRAPAVPRWQAFVVALQQGLPLERVRSEMFNAGQEWEEALSAAGVATFAAAIANAWEDLPKRLEAGGQPESVILSLASEARRASGADEPTVGLALAERALTALLTKHAAGDQPLASRTADSAAEEFTRTRGAPQQLVTAYVGELLSQFTKHVAFREAGTLTEGETPIGIGESRRLIRQLAGSAETAAHELPDPGASPAEVRDRWRSLIRKAFERGRELPEAPQ